MSSLCKGPCDLFPVGKVGGNRMKKRLSKRDWARIIGLISVLLILLKVAQRNHVWPF